MTGTVLKFQSKRTPPAKSDSAKTRVYAEDLKLIDAFCGYADAVELAVREGPLSPADRFIIREFGKILLQAEGPS